MGSPRAGDHTTTYTGRKFYPLDPRPEDFSIKDIAAGLSREARWGGQTEWTFSVAQHSVLVAQIVPVDYQLYALLHDASEAYLKDLPGPVKHLRAMEAYREIERNVQHTIYRAFGLEPLPAEEYESVIKTADRKVLVTEARDLFSPSRVMTTPQYRGIAPLSDTIYPWSELESRNFFLRAFREATGLAEDRLVLCA